MFEDSTHGGRQNWWLRYPTFLRTSTHALTEGDSFIGNWRCALIISTHALTEGDKDSVAVAADALISTHALTEGDAVLPGMYRRTAHFNSRPHGGRRTSYTVSYECLKFQLTPSRRATIDKDVIIAYNIFQLTPSRRATQYDYQSDGNDQISTHALTEGDSGSPNHYADYTFQLTPSRRATLSLDIRPVEGCISTHALTEGDVVVGFLDIIANISTHALTEGDTIQTVN